MVRRPACCAPRTVPQARPPRTSRRVPALPRRPPGLLPSLQRSPRSRSPIDQPLPPPGRRLLSSASLAAKALRRGVGPGAEWGLRAPRERPPPLDRSQRRIPAAGRCLPSGTADLSCRVGVALGYPLCHHEKHLQEEPGAKCGSGHHHCHNAPCTRRTCRQLYREHGSWGEPRRHVRQAEGEILQ